MTCRNLLDGRSLFHSCRHSHIQSFYPIGMTAQPEYMFLVKSLDWQKKESAGLFFLLSLLLASQHQKNSRGEKLYPFYIVRIFEKDDHQMKKAAFSNVFVWFKGLKFDHPKLFFTPKKRPNRWFCLRQEIPWWKLPRLWCCLEREIQKDWLWPESGFRTSPRFGRSNEAFNCILIWLA